MTDLSSTRSVLVLTAVLLLCHRACAANHSVALNESKIIGGRALDINDAPFAVRLFLRNVNTHSYRSCGGSVINKFHVLTAAHCVENYVASDIIVVYDTTAATPRSTRQTGVQRINRHPKFKSHKVFNGYGFAYDVAVLRTKNPVPVDIIKIAPVSTRDIPAGTKLTVAGWGSTQGINKPLSDRLMTTEFIVMNSRRCLSASKGELDTSEFCTLESSTHAQCDGDSGGPVYNAQTDTQYGVVSSGTCGTTTKFGINADLTEPEVHRFVKRFT